MKCNCHKMDRYFADGYSFNTIGIYKLPFTLFFCSPHPSAEVCVDDLTPFLSSVDTAGFQLSFSQIVILRNGFSDPVRKFLSQIGKFRTEEFSTPLPLYGFQRYLDGKIFVAKLMNEWFLPQNGIDPN